MDIPFVQLPKILKTAKHAWYIRYVWRFDRPLAHTDISCSDSILLTGGITGFGISIVLVIIPLCFFPVYSNTNDSLVSFFDLPEDLIDIRIIYTVGYTPLPL